MSAWFNYTATLKILIFSLLAGALLPGLFAVGVRLQAAGDGADATAPPAPAAGCRQLGDLRAGACGSHHWSAVYRP